MKNYALINDGQIQNIAVVDDETDDGKAYLNAIAGLYESVLEVENASIGQKVDDDGELVPLPGASAEAD